MSSTTAMLGAAGASGALFGAALAASGVFSPAVVVAQMRLEDFHMMKVFLTATAGSALVVNAFSRLNLVHVAPRPSSSLGLFPYDGNVLGGLGIGFGMALAGACPGTVFVQVGAGEPSGIACLAGGIVGAVVYATGLIDRIAAPGKGKTSRVESQAAANGKANSEAAKSQARQLTVHGKLDVSVNTALLAFEVMCVAAVAAVTFLFEEGHQFSVRTASGALHPLVGGALVALAQAASLLLTGGALGASAFYADAARYVLRAVGAKTVGQPSPKSLVFTAGVVAAAYLVTSRIPGVAFAAAASTSVRLSVPRSLLGGFFLAFGARMAGGCTSGHGISGMSSMSIASFISVAAMFAGGMGLALFV